jgi:PKD repeat protein
MKIVFWAALFSVITMPACNKKDSKTNTAPVAKFVASGYEVPAPCPVTFINTSSNATGYFWNFGDGSTSAESNPVHTYSFIGTYTVRLKITGPEGTDSVCKLLTISDITGNKSSFSYFNEKCSGTPVGVAFKTVNPASSNTVWDFSNGVINTSRDPIIQFLLPGDYTIKYSSQIGGVRDTVVRVLRID